MTPQEEAELFWKNMYEKLRRRVKVLSARRFVSEFEAKSFTGSDLQQIVEKDLVRDLSGEVSKFARIKKETDPHGNEIISATLMVVEEK